MKKLLDKIFCILVCVIAGIYFEISGWFRKDKDDGEHYKGEDY